MYFGSHFSVTILSSDILQIDINIPNENYTGDKAEPMCDMSEAKKNAGLAW